MSKLISLVLVCLSISVIVPSFALEPKVAEKMQNLSKVNVDKTSNSLNNVSSQVSINKIDLNKATAIEIAKFNGFGPKRSQAIVEYRNEHGVFKSFNDLSLVKGISKRFVEKNLEKLQQTFVI